MDLAKLVAAFVRSEQRVEDTFGTGLLAGRACRLVCMLTTSGTGSEVSPGAEMAAAAMTVQRLLRNNPREISLTDAEQIYLQCFGS